MNMQKICSRDDISYFHLKGLCPTNNKAELKCTLSIFYVWCSQYWQWNAYIFLVFILSFLRQTSSYDNRNNIVIISFKTRQELQTNTYITVPSKLRATSTIKEKGIDKYANALTKMCTQYTGNTMHKQQCVALEFSWRREHERSTFIGSAKYLFFWKML